MLKTTQRKLFRMAFLTAPLIGLLGIMPVLLFIQTLAPEKIALIDPNIWKLLRGILIVTSSIFVQWFINIGIWKVFEQRYSLLKRKEIYRYMLSFILILGLALFANIFMSEQRPIKPGSFGWYPIIWAITSNSFILVLMNLVITQNEKAALKLEKAELEISQLITQQAQLKQQIHPHFLFNALGTLQILIQKNQEKAGVYTQKLATFLRSSIDLAENDILPISEEIRFFENYIQLQQMRFIDGIHYSITIPETVQTQGRLPVFALQTLAENAIKHNAFSAKSPLQLDIQYNENKHWLVISNRKSPKFKPKSGTGIGLQNLTKRYALFTENVPIIEDTETGVSKIVAYLFL